MATGEELAKRASYMRKWLRCRTEKQIEAAKTRSHFYYEKSKEKIKDRSKRWASANPERRRASINARRAITREKRSAYDRVQYLKNVEKMRARSKTPEFRAWAKQNRLKKWSDQNFRMKVTLRRRLWQAIRGYSKTSSAITLLGCSVEVFRAYIERQFKPGMSWENYGHKTWHIDHIKPCFDFDLTDPAQQAICFHFSNMQPLWATENHMKNRFTFPRVPQ